MKKIISVVMVMSLLFFGNPVNIFAQSWQGNRSEKSPAELKVKTDDQGALYLDFKGATLMNVLKTLSEITHINFVAGNEISTREVNMSLDGVTLDQALQAIAQGVNVTYDYIPNTQIIMFRASADSPTLAPLLTRVFKLYFLRASQIREIDAGQSSSGGSGSSSTGLQALTSGADQKSDKAETEDMPIMKVVQKMLSERGSVSVDDRTNSLVVTDSEDRLDRVAAIIAELDKPLNQVLISVILVETFEDLDRELGVEWARGTGAADGLFGELSGGSQASKFPYNLNDTLPFKIPGLNTDAPVGSDALTNDGVQDFQSLNIRVKALQNASKLKILAKPNVLVMDNHPAIIKIVTNAAIGNTTVVTGTGGTAGSGGTGSTTSTAERAEVGTILRVTPQINTQKQITMTIEPTFATVDSSTIAIGTAETGDPTVRAARTTVMVNSGATLVMGGLMFSTHSDGDRKVPILADVPLIGKLFTKDNKTIQDRELVLFINPQIITNPMSLQMNNVPGRGQRFDDEAAQFWKFKKKNWYKNMKNPPVPAPDFDNYFKARENTMDQMAAELTTEKQSTMSDAASGAMAEGMASAKTGVMTSEKSVAPVTDAKNANWEVR